MNYHIYDKYLRNEESKKDDLSAFDMERLKLKIGSFVSIYSRSKGCWIKGKIVNIYVDKTNKEWLIVKYNNMMKHIQRFCEALQPMTISLYSSPKINWIQYPNNDTYNNLTNIYMDNKINDMSSKFFGMLPTKPIDNKYKSSKNKLTKRRANSLQIIPTINMDVLPSTKQPKRLKTKVISGCDGSGCGATKRMVNALMLSQALDTNNENNKLCPQQMIIFSKEKYKKCVINDYMHILTKHTEQLEEIYSFMLSDEYAVISK